MRQVSATTARYVGLEPVPGVRGTGELLLPGEEIRVARWLTTIVAGERAIVEKQDASGKATYTAWNLPAGDVETFVP